MKRFGSALFFLCFSALASAQVFPTDISIDGQQLQQCSKTDIKVLKFIDVGQAALFTSNCGALPNLTAEMQLSFIYHREFEAEDFIEASEKLLQRNLSETEYQQIEADLAQFNQSFQPVIEGDRYDIQLSEQGLSLIKNGTVISHSDSTLLGKQYYQIWFGKKPFNSNMKQALLHPDAG